MLNVRGEKRHVQSVESVDEEVEYWESHSTAPHWDEMEKVDVEIDLPRNLFHPKIVYLADRPTRCPRCHGELEESMIQDITFFDGRLVVISEMPMLRCRASGHEYMLEKTLDEVEQILHLDKAQKLRPVEMMHVPVFKLGMAA